MYNLVVDMCKMGVKDRLAVTGFEIVVFNKVDVELVIDLCQIVRHTRIAVMELYSGTCII